MKRFFRSIIACICGLTIVFSSAVPPAFARDGVIGGVVDGVQSFTEWGVNNLNSFWKIIFGDDFNSASEEELKAAYDDYVETLPAPGYTSAGCLTWQPTISDLYESSDDFSYVTINDENIALSSLPSEAVSPKFCHYNIGLWERGLTISGHSLSSIGITGGVVPVRFVFVPPVSGSYRLTNSLASICSSVSTTNVTTSLERRYSEGSSFSYISSIDCVSASLTSSSKLGSFTLTFNSQVYFPVYEIIPDTVSSDTYNINTRPTSITGGNYGIVGDNGQITKVEDNSTIINETNNTFYNPATGQTVPITNWSYDYSDRSYKVTLESGDTATITYGDENISITETTVNESGDTITNNYTIYYLIDGSGSENPSCSHEWTETSTTPATCTLPGSAVYTCSKCQQTKTETLPAWQVKQTVTTQYDDTGQLVQQGYTIFECSTCHEQYKSTDGTIPPGGGSGTDPGGDEEGGGFLSWLLGKLGELLGTIGNGILNLLQTALEKIFGGLIDLVNSLFENLAKLVDLFGSVGEAFQVLWTWLPPEIIAILVAGVSIFVFVALLKFFMK